MTAQQIINDVAGYYGITPDELIHGDKHRVYAEPRQVASYLIRHVLKLTYMAIGDIFSKKCQTIMYSVWKVEDWVREPVLNRYAVNCINTLRTKKGGATGK